MVGFLAGLAAGTGPDMQSCVIEAPHVVLRHAAVPLVCTGAGFLTGKVAARARRSM